MYFYIEHCIMPAIPSVNQICDDSKQLSCTPNVASNLLLFPDLAPARKCVCVW